MNFGVDHYKPKGIERFKDLECNYDNLYYCCSSCNSRKNDYWPADEEHDPYVVNPCDFQMMQHLRFNRQTCEIEGNTPHGDHTIELLQLNEKATVEYRRTTLTLIDLCAREVMCLTRQRKQIEEMLRKGKITKLEHDLEIASIIRQIEDIQDLEQRHAGTLPLPPLPNVRLGLRVL